MSDTLLLIVLHDSPGYSVFDQPTIFGVDYGNSLRPDFQWAPGSSLPISHLDATEETVDSAYRENRSSYDIILLIDGTEAQKLS